MFLAVTVFAFVTFWVIPANPAALNGGGLSPELLRNREHLMGIDRPLPVQYARFVWNLVGHGSLGYSFATRRSVNQIIGDAAPITASLVIGGGVLWLLVALPIGILSALRPRSLLDRLGTTFTLVGISAHPLLVGLLLSYVFGFRLGWFPITGYCDFIHPSGAEDCGGPTQWTYHLVLPWITFAVLYAALYVRMVRASVIETLNADWVVVAHAKGGSFAHVLRTHVLRNALLPIVTMIGMDIAVALGGTLFVESVWGLPGLGQTALASLNQRDLPVTEGVVVFVAIVVIVLNLVVDATYTLIDPRIRLREAH